MKIAVISDIHGNVEALDAVLADIEDQGCDRIFCLGDYAMAGPEPDKILDILLKIKDKYDIKMIQGNTDLMIAEYNDEVYNAVKNGAPVMAEALKNDYVLLSESQKQFLKDLPEKLALEVEGVKILLVHGSPRKNNENIFPDTPLSELENMLDGVEADYILCGHTHIPCGIQTKSGKTVVNAGSIGRPFTDVPDSCYLVLTLSNGNCIFEHRFVEYDKETASQKLSKREFEGSQKLAQMLLKPVVRHF